MLPVNSKKYRFNRKENFTAFNMGLYNMQQKQDIAHKSQQQFM